VRFLTRMALDLVRLCGSRRAVFQHIYENGIWRTGETVSGPGSTRERAADFRDDLIALLGRLDTRILLDAGCGDFNWMAEVAGTVKTYIGVDVVPELVQETARRHPDQTFLCRDIATDPLPAADVVLCRDCLVHLPLDDARAVIRNFARSGSKYLLTTTFVDTDHNTDILAGGWRPLNLLRPPFSFPPPLAEVDERCLHTGGRGRGKRLGLWDLQAPPLSS
jgi:SAM-dependent methyltransferase